MDRLKFYLLFLLSAFSLGVSAQTDFFGIPKMEIGGEEYSLVWSAKIKFRYVEDFLPKKVTNSHFTSKVSLDFYDADVDVEKVANFKIAELEASKTENLVTNLTHSVASNGEYLIEYVAFVQGGDKMQVAEWNLCRLIANNSKGVALLQMKRREYDIKLEKFISHVEKKKSGWVKEVLSYKLPDLVVKNQ